MLNGDYPGFAERLRSTAESSFVRGVQDGGHYVSNHLRDAANIIDSWRQIRAALAELLDASRECTEKADGPQDESDAAVERLIAAENAAEAVLAKARGE
jgi:hypothetical protein